MKNRLGKLAVIATALLAASLGAHAQSIVGATHVSATAGEPLDMPAPYALANLINQSGLSALYQSGVTDFDAYTSSTFHCAYCTSPTVPEGGVAAFGSNYGTITFDLGSTLTIDKIAVWNDLGAASLRSFDLIANGTVLGSYTMPVSSTLADVGSVFAFGPVTTQTIQMKITGNYGDPLGTMLNEVAFESAPAPVTPVPEPETYAMLLAGLGVVGLLAKRRGV